MVYDKKSDNVLELVDIKASYKFHTVVAGKDVYEEIEVVHGISLSIGEGEIVSILGANGAGKTTLMLAITGLLDKQPINGRTSGEIKFKGHIINGQSPEQIVRSGITLVPEGKLLFPSLSVKDNLELGFYAVRNKIDKKTRKRNFDNVCQIFPRLKEREHQLCDRLSGGEAQMVAVARGFLAQPQVLLLDEPCLGLAPLIVKELMDSLSRLRNEFGMTILLAEQNALAALKIADRGYVLKTGNVVAEDSAEHLLGSETIKMAYLGK